VANANELLNNDLVYYPLPPVDDSFNTKGTTVNRVSSLALTSDFLRNV